MSRQTIPVFVHRDGGCFHATAGTQEAHGTSTMRAARLAAAHHFGVAETRVAVDATSPYGADRRCVVHAALKPAGSPIAWGPLWVALACLLSIMVLFGLVGCSSSKSIEDDPTELAKLPQWTQVAFALRAPLMILAWAFIIRDGPLLVWRGRKDKKAKEDKS